MKLFTQFIIYIDNCCTYNYFFFIEKERERDGANGELVSDMVY